MGGRAETVGGRENNSLKGIDMKLQRIGFEMTTGKLIRVAVLAATLLGFGSAAQAALVSCPTSFTTDPTAKVEDATGTTTAASACQYIAPPSTSNVGSIENINAAGFFGFSDWTVNGTNGQVDTNNQLSGTWAIASPDFINNNYIIVFKDGADTNLVAFFFNELYANGVWSSPFTEPPFDFQNDGTTKAVSHYTIAQRVGTEPPCEVDCGPRRIPEPNSLALMSLGLLGAAFVVKRRRSHRRA